MIGAESKKAKHNTMSPFGWLNKYHLGMCLAYPMHHLLAKLQDDACVARYYLTWCSLQAKRHPTWCNKSQMNPDMVLHLAFCLFALGCLFFVSLFGADNIQ